MEKVGSVVVSCNFSHVPDQDILLVGKQKNKKIEVINAFQGPEAYELWKKLTIKKKKG